MMKIARTDGLGLLLVCRTHALIIEVLAVNFVQV